MNSKKYDGKYGLVGPAVVMLLGLLIINGCGVKSSMLKFGYERDEQSGVRICVPCLDTVKK